MSSQQQNGYPQNQPNFGPHGFGPHGNFGFNQNQNNQQFPGRRFEPGFNQNQGGFPQRNNFFPPHGPNFNQQGFNQQQYQQQQQPEPEPAHEHPLNFEGRLNEKCKICLQNIGDNGGYKCKDCPIVLCLNCSQRIFYGNKNKQLHQHDVLLQDRNSWTCDICKTSYLDNASFYCKQCDFDVCERCYLNDNLPQQQFPRPQQRPPFPQPQPQNQPQFPQPQSQQQYPQPQSQYPQPRPQFAPPQSEQQYPQPQSQYPQPHPQPNQQPPYQQPQSQFPQPPFKPNQNQQYGPHGQYPHQQPEYAPQQNVSQSQGEYQQPYNQGGNYIPQGQNYNQQNQQDYYQQQYQEQELQPESDHEHPLNYEEKLNEKCKICLQNIAGNGGYKCKDCPIVLCVNCSDRIFYDYKNKEIHQHELFLKAKNNWNCNNCNRHKQENAAFSCNQCNFDVCDECYIGQNLQGYQYQQNTNSQQSPIQQFNQQMQPAYVQAQQQEEYESFHEHPLNYEEKLNANCKICLKNIGGKDGYKCKDCPIILCIECLNAIYYGGKKKNLHNHELVLNDRNNWTCNICKKKNGNASFYCPQCDFDVCYQCYLEKSQQITPNNNQNNGANRQDVVSEADSGHEHPLYYEENLKQNCKLCSKKISEQKGYKCKKCEIVLCLGCSNKIFFKEKNKSFHKHDLLLKPRKAWKCNKCLKRSKNNVSFYCKKCDYDACVDCYIKK